MLIKPIVKRTPLYFTNLLDYLIYYCFVFFSFVDCLTGLFLQVGLPSIGVPFKLFLMVLLFLGMKSESKMTTVVYFLSLFFCCALVYLFQNYTNFSTSLSMILKIMMYPFVLFYFTDTYSKLPNGTELIKNICYFNFLTIFINQIMGIMGLGFSTYSDGGFGIKGFYFDGNAMAVVCFCLFAYYISIEKKYMIAFLIAVCSFLLGTKTAILAIFLYFFLILFYRANRNSKRVIFIIFVVSILTLVYVVMYTDFLSYQVERVKRLYKLFKGKILSVALSGRDLDLQQHITFYNNHFSIKQFLFGYGYRKNVKIIELDFFDTLLSYGVLFCTLISFLYIYPIILNRKNKEIIFFNLLILLITFTSGHVWYNTSTALFFVINNVYFKVKKSEKNILYN